MKADISANGILTITAETPLEQYALRNWSKQNEERIIDEDPDEPDEFICAFRNIIIGAGDAHTNRIPKEPEDETG